MTNAYGYNATIVDIHPEDLQHNQQLLRYKYLLAGVLLAILTYSLLQLLVYRDRILLYYCMLLLGITPGFLYSLNLAPIFDYTQMLLPLPPLWHWIFGLTSSSLGIIGLLKLMQIVLQLNDYFPRFNRMTQYFVGIECINWAINIVVLVGIIIGPEQDNEHVFRAFENVKRSIHGLFMLFVLWVAVKAFLKKVPLGWNFLLAVLPLCLAIINGAILKPYFFPDLPVYSPYFIGLLLTLMLFGILVGGQFNLLKLKESRAAQQSTELQNQLLQIESKALRAQMNPHFIFNCLNSIKSLIQDKANKQAVHYLTLFSKFIRQVLHHSEEKQISLEEELEMSRLYIEMEKLRFGKSFTYRVEIDPIVDTSFFRVPPMILQPFLENAIWHGLMHKEGEREIRLIIQSEEEGVKCIVEDNGIGRERAATLNLHRQHQHRSFGTRLILDRLKVNKELFNRNFMVNTIDKMTNGRATGTRVELSLGG